MWCSVTKHCNLRYRNVYVACLGRHTSTFCSASIKIDLVHKMHLLYLWRPSGFNLTGDKENKSSETKKVEQTVAFLHRETFRCHEQEGLNQTSWTKPMCDPSLEKFLHQACSPKGPKNVPALLRDLWISAARTGRSKRRNARKKGMAPLIRLIFICCAIPPSPRVIPPQVTGNPKRSHHP